MSMKYFIEILKPLIGVAVFAVVIYFGYLIVSQGMKSQAIDACLKTASYTSKVGNETSNNTSVEPMKNWYEFCMKSKGYKVATIK